MRSTVIAEGQHYSITSYGNGWAYTLLDKRDGLSVFVQGEDATTFRADWEDIEEHNPEWSQDDVLGWLWHGLDYGFAASRSDAV